jgi:hypothetical protein
MLSLDAATRQCHFTGLDITKKVTEHTFKEKDSRRVSKRDPGDTVHNCLVDCHAEVWTRFPVLAAVRRQTILSSTNRIPKTLTFVTKLNHSVYSGHFSQLIQLFERSTRKPTGDELKSIRILTITFDTFVAGINDGTDWEVTCFRAGEWLVDLLCLIPIHLAITRENRFVPLKDGVSSAALEKSLLGADVSRIVDSLSFGWYESLFQSYMASKVRPPQQFFVHLSRFI